MKPLFLIRLIPDRKTNPTNPIQENKAVNTSKNSNIDSIILTASFRN